jgi:hypothetical protein
LRCRRSCVDLFVAPPIMSKKEKAQVHSGLYPSPEPSSLSLTSLPSSLLSLGDFTLSSVSIGYRSAVFNPDTSGCTALTGNLKKKNSHGVWQTRYFYLNNDFLIYKKDNRSTEIKGVVDAGDIASLASSPKGDITLTMTGGEELNLKGNDAREASRWVLAIQERMDWVQRERELAEAGRAAIAQAAAEPTDDRSIKQSGWLMKKSPHKYGGMQERFVRLENNFLMYFKKEGEPITSALGTINLESADWVRPYDSSTGTLPPPLCIAHQLQTAASSKSIHSKESLFSKPRVELRC